VRSTGKNQRGEVVLDYARWVMVKKRDKNAPVGPEVVPALPNPWRRRSRQGGP